MCYTIHIQGLYISNCAYTLTEKKRKLGTSPLNSPLSQPGQVDLRYLLTLVRILLPYYYISRGGGEGDEGKGVMSDTR